MRKGEVTRQRITEKAAALFNQKGYEGCSMQDLMEATGLKKGGVYRHFANKEELAAEAFSFALKQTTKIRTEPLDEVTGAADKLRLAVHLFIAAPSAVPGGCPLMNTAIDSDDGNPALRLLALNGIREWRARLAVIIDDGVRTGEFLQGTSSRQVSNTIIAALEGALMISRLERTSTALHDAQTALEKLISDLKVAGK